MTLRSHIRPRLRRLRALGTSALLVAGALGTGVLGATAAHADATATMTGYDVPEALAPYRSSTVETIPAYLDLAFDITCYVTGETVSGTYGASNIWDMVSSVGPYGANGTFIPDALVYTGSNSPVVPHCSSALGHIIGNGPVVVRSGRGGGYSSVGDNLSVGEYVEIACYGVGQAVTGPYGTETLWDKLTEGPVNSSGEWIPDALVYTGSNSAVVPPC
ncbi:hypothetical protein ACWERV_32465 [Streptomyces sp. NPDC004031]